MTRRSLRDRPVRTIRNRGVTRGSAGRTSGVRKDDLADAKDKRKPKGVTSPIKDAAKKVEKQPTPKPDAPPADKMDTKTPVTKPNVGKQTADKPKPPPEVTKRPRVTGKGTDMKSRDVTKEGPMGKRTLANVTADQLKAAGLTTGPKGLRTYLNMYNKLKRRPKPSDFKKKTEQKPFDPTKPNTGGGPGRSSIKPPKRQSAMATAAAMGAKPKDEMGMKYGGMKKMRVGGMKSKMSTKGGAMGGKKKMAPGMKKGGKFPDLTGDGKVTKKDVLKGRGVPGFKEGGKKVSKGYAKGGMKPKTTTKKKVSKAKVRGAGMARKGVRPVKYR
jgi:hypothetical protein